MTTIVGKPENLRLHKRPEILKSQLTAAVFGAVLRELRKKQPLSQEKLAFDAGLDRTYISLLELGQRSPSLETMLALARALHISLAHLASLVEDRLSETNNPDSSI